jgi:hypothetical protein
MANKKAPNRALSGEQLAKATAENDSDRYHQREGTIQRNYRTARVNHQSGRYLYARCIRTALYGLFRLFGRPIELSIPLDHLCRLNRPRRLDNPWYVLTGHNVTALSQGCFGLHSLRPKWRIR